MKNDPTRAAAEGTSNALPLHYGIRNACQAYLTEGDQAALRDVVTTPAGRFGEVREKAKVLATFTAPQMRSSAIARALAISIAEDLVREPEPILVVPLPGITDEREREIAEAYSDWLFMERRLLSHQLYPNVSGAENFVPGNTLASNFHFPPDRFWHDEPMPSVRAELILRLVGAIPGSHVMEEGTEKMAEQAPSHPEAST